MTLHDAGLWLRAATAFFGVCGLLRVLYPFYQERKQKREADERRHAEAEREMNRQYY